ncbi:hypothetical protein QU481_04520 [Crenobacter sp. SG2303]|uniref:DUF2875 domain-containing protein n=1 Tax=Crenobacter oryzisoli TaxID=3056844 RepID=A0ABT7XK42_9NEIS|nr:hypothetical protein [Crenobacter sp. SG2303]MDN0074152.1 hypothetical protein [Crenobacter sp. SG2303]
MWKLLGLFIALLIGWWGTLWLGLPLSWQRISPTALLALHLAPPVLLLAAWRLWLRWREKRQEEEAQAAETKAEADRQAQRDAARARHQQALDERRVGVACRWLWSRALPAKEAPAWLGEVVDGCNWSVLEADELEPDEVLTALSPHLSELFAELYATAPGTAWLPLYFEAIPSQSGIEQLETLRQLQQQVLAEQLPDERLPAQRDCRFLPGTGPLANRIQQVLQQDPALPGLVVLAADAPLALLDEGDDWGEPAPAVQQARRWQGQPGAAISALLFLRQSLPDPAEPEAIDADQTDPYQPYWEKPLTDQGGSWGGVPPRWQASLAELPSLAELRLAESTEITEQKGLARQIQPLLDNALVNATLLDYPFSEDERDPAVDQAETLAWLVHNSGDADVGGHRLAAVATALSHHAVELNPIDEASNSVREWGDVGAAAPVLLYSIAVSHSARLEAPAVLAHFDPQHLNLGLVRPVAAPPEPAEEQAA